MVLLRKQEISRIFLRSEGYSLYKPPIRPGQGIQKMYNLPGIRSLVRVIEQNV